MLKHLGPDTQMRILGAELGHVSKIPVTGREKFAHGLLQTRPRRGGLGGGWLQYEVGVEEVLLELFALIWGFEERSHARIECIE